MLIWLLVPDMWCDISQRRENCKFQLLGPDVSRAQLVLICALARGCVTDTDITYLLAHVINSNRFNFDRLLKVDVMNPPVDG